MYGELALGSEVIDNFLQSGDAPGVVLAGGHKEYLVGINENLIIICIGLAVMFLPTALGAWAGDAFRNWQNRRRERQSFMRDYR